MAQGYPTGGPGKNPRTGLKFIMLALCVLVLVAASVYIVNGGLGLPEGPEGPRIRWSWREGWFGVQDAPGAAEDYRDVFGALYTAPEEAPGSRLARTAGTAEGRIALESAEGGELSLRELYDRVIDSVVGVRVYYEGRSGHGWGSGVVMSAEGYILTNQHMVDEAVRAAVVLRDGSEYDALLVGEDAQTDLAVLKIEAKGLSPAAFGDSEAIEVGDRVVAIGNPLGSELSGTMTDGIVSAINRDVKMNGRAMTLLQTNAALNEGSSGGALVNLYGQVVGVTFMKMSGASSGVAVEGLGFAIPSATVKAVTDQLLTEGVVRGRPGLGLTLGPVTAEQAARYGLPEGLYVYAVAADSDAWEKGLRAGDVLTRVDGEDVRSTADVLEKRDARAVGDSLRLTLWRDGEIFEADVILIDQNLLS